MTVGRSVGRRLTDHAGTRLSPYGLFADKTPPAGQDAHNGSTRRRPDRTAAVGGGKLAFS